MKISRSEKNTLIACGGAHFVQDGLVALQYVLLPILAQVFGLGYSQVGLIRGLNNTAMTLLEIPSGLLAGRWGERNLMVGGLLGVGVGYCLVAMSTTYLFLVICFLIAGAGAAFQHSLASSCIVNTFSGGTRRKVMGTYNALGDGGKLTFTGCFSILIGAGLGWRFSVTVLALMGIVFAFAVWALLKPVKKGADICEEGQANPKDDSQTASVSGWGIVSVRKFSALSVSIFFDSMVQGVFLTFLGFVMLSKGSSEGIAAFAVVLTLAGGMVGKFACGFLSAKTGDLSAFWGAQIFTIVGLILIIVLPLTWIVILLPVIGVFMQGSSTVTYGAVADFVGSQHQARGYALIYSVASTGVVIGPFIFGVVADQFGLVSMLWMLVACVALSLPSSVVLSTKGENPLPT